MKKHIGVLVGSLRKDSWNKKVANSLIALAPDTLSFEIIDISKLPLYNEDLDKTPPDEWVAFRDKVKACDGILFVTPEYNRSVPGVLKNAIDVGSRPYGQSAWDAKPAGVMSASVSSVGGFGANQHLRQSLVTLNVPAMPAPEVYIGNVAKLFNEKGELTNPDVQGILKKFAATFANWVGEF